MQFCPKVNNTEFPENNIKKINSINTILEWAFT